MDKRKYTRRKIRQFARIGGKFGVVNDISDGGIQIATAFLPKTRKVKISFEANGQTIDIIGNIKWIKKTQSYQNPNQLGLVIEEAPKEYYHWIDKMNQS